MLNKLRKSELCPIHHSFYCCGRERLNHSGRKAWQRNVRKDFNSRQKSTKADWVQVAPGVWRIPDEHHPRGFRERRSKAAMRELLKKKCDSQRGECGICHEPMTDFREVVPDHIEPRGMGGAWRDDHPDNIQATHAVCNGEKGSQRNYVPSRNL